MEAVHRLARRHRVAWTTRRSLLAYGDWITPQAVIRLMCPLTLMNASGKAMTAAAGWGVLLHETLIVCDDVNLPLGTLRLRPQGSDGGHHGLASCLTALGTQAVPRLRIGVGRQPMPKDLTGFVLSTFDAEERPIATTMVGTAVEACEAWVEQGIEGAMNRVNSRRPS